MPWRRGSPGFRLVDKQGREFERRGTLIRAMPGGAEFDLNYFLPVHGPKPGRPMKLIADYWDEVRYQVPFELRDIAVP